MAQASAATQPLVRLGNPFYIAVSYLAQCIDGVLAQIYLHFEYILTDNCSIGGSDEIVENYARRDPRSRLICRSDLVSFKANTIRPWISTSRFFVRDKGLS
jgi:glycosyltransferase involved in cell wall biosynthesis